jgi:predicted CXXCH cytochrome family protein
MRLKAKGHWSGLRLWFAFWVTLLFVGMMFQGCSRATRHRILSFFFDGVPPLEEPGATNAMDSLQEEAETVEVDADTTAPEQSAWSSHPALEDSQCATCHDPDQSYRLMEEPESLCLTCHDDKTENDYVHAPVDAGECLECHNPHGTQNPSLLVLTGQELCFQCHDAVDIKSSETHEGIEDTACYECHDPHGGDGDYFLR